MRPTGPPSESRRGELLEMGAQARQLLADVGLLRPHRDLGGDAGLVDLRLAEEGLDPLAQPGRSPFHRDGRALGDQVDLGHERRVKSELAAERRALGLPPVTSSARAAVNVCSSNGHASSAVSGRLGLARDHARLPEQPGHGRPADQAGLVGQRGARSPRTRAPAPDRP